MDSQRLLRNVWGDSSVRRDGIKEFSNVWMIVYAHWLPQNRVCKDSCNAEGLIPHRVTIVPAYLEELLNEPNLRLFHAK